jgi:hypothetical protein
MPAHTHIKTPYTARLRITFLIDVLENTKTLLNDKNTWLPNGLRYLRWVGTAKPSNQKNDKA